jgi:hypothetical protein
MHSRQSEPAPIPWTPNLTRMLAKSTRQECSMVAKRSQVEDALAEYTPLAWVARPLEFAAWTSAARLGTFATSVRASRAGCF